ncbi:MAG: DUF1638 domain-containing protein [Spirochaetota bacterium]
MKYFIVCDTILVECRSLIPDDVTVVKLPFALHSTPEKLQQKLQEEIDAIPGEGAHILIGFGLCSNGAVGLSSKRHWLYLPKVHDCIALFSGSQERFHEITDSELGTLYMTKRFMENEQGHYHLMEYDAYVQRYGEELAHTYIGMLLNSYTRGMLIESGEYDIQPYRNMAQRFCTQHDLRFEQISADLTLVEQLFAANVSDDRIICKEPGESVELDDYLCV